MTIATGSKPADILQLQAMPPAASNVLAKQATPHDQADLLQLYVQRPQFGGRHGFCMQCPGASGSSGSSGSR